MTRERLHSGCFNRKRYATGFTLIEVVVATAILGVALTVIIELFSGGLRLARTSAEYTKGINYARMKMEEMTVKQTIGEGSEEGEFDATYRWRVETKRVDIIPVEKGLDFNPPVELFQININVSWKSGLKERSTGIESYRMIRSEDEEKKS
jgi:general secretion pathway protein I